MALVRGVVAVVGAAIMATIGAAESTVVSVKVAMGVIVAQARVTQVQVEIAMPVVIVAAWGRGAAVPAEGGDVTNATTAPTNGGAVHEARLGVVTSAVARPSSTHHC